MSKCNRRGPTVVVPKWKEALQTARLANAEALTTEHQRSIGLPGCLSHITPAQTTIDV